MGCIVNENNKVSCFKDSLASTPCGDIYLGDLSKYFAVPLEQVCARFDDLGIDYDSTQRRVNEN